MFPGMKDAGPFDKNDSEDAKRWESVEEAVELVNEERYKEALGFLREVLEKDPKNAYAYHWVGVAMYESGELEPARDAYRAAVTLAPKYAGARIALSHVLRQLGDYKEAIKDGMIALEQQPGDADALYAVGMAYYARGDKAAAKRYLQAFLDAKPELETSIEVQGILDAIEQGL
jgi:tetratricopeptide (TPR) repeat protein